MPRVPVCYFAAILTIWTATFALIQPVHGADDESAARVTAVPDSIRETFRLGPFYKKCVVTQEFPIVASDKVADAALVEAAYIVDRMLAGRDDLRAALVRNRVRLAVMAPTELTTDIPEHSDLKPAEYWNKRARGLGATRRRPAVSCAEENLLCYPGDPYHGENILIHEFAHAIHEMGLNSIDRSFDDQLAEAFAQAKSAGLWKGTYAMTNRAEYWAEGVQSWFDSNRTNNHDHNHIATREALQEYDPQLARLLGSVFGKNDWRYARPDQRKAEPAKQEPSTAADSPESAPQ